MLSKMSITLEDFLKYTTSLPEDTIFRHKFLIQNIINSILNSNISDLSSYQSEAICLQEYFLALALKGKTSSLKLSEIDTLYEYLTNIKYWRTADFCTLFLSMHYLKTRQLTYLLEGFFTESNFPLVSNEIFFFLICQIIFYLISNDNQECSRHFINYVSLNNYKHHTMYTRNLLQFTQGYWIAKFEDYTRGIIQLKKALEIFEILENPSTANYYKKMYNNFTNSYGKTPI